MLGLVLKAAATAMFIVALAEIAKRSPSIAGLLVALPLATAMTMILMQLDGEGSDKIVKFAWSTLIFVPPGTVFVVGMWLGLRDGYDFWLTLIATLAATAMMFWVYATVLGRFGVQLFEG